MTSNNKTNTVTLAGFVITFLGSILFSTKAVIVKFAFAKTPMDALTLLMLRMAFSFPFYIIAALIAGSKKDIVPLTMRQWMYIFLLGLFGYYLSSLFDFIGLQYISAGLERLILFLYPTLVVLINLAVFRQPINRMQWLALFLTYTGIGIAYFAEFQVDFGNPNFLWGSLLIFLCSITYATYIVGSGRAIPSVGATRFTAYAMLASTFGVFVHFAIAGNPGAIEQASHYWWYGILLAVVATVLPSFMISNGMKRIGSSNVAIISAVGPISTIIQAHYIVGEKIFTEQIVGTVLVVAGVLLIGWKGSKSLSKS